MGVNVFKIQTNKDVDINQTSKSGNGLLHAAVNTGDPSIVKLLLEAGVDVNQKNFECDGVMPLHLAIMQGRQPFESMTLCFLLCYLNGLFSLLFFNI